MISDMGMQRRLIFGGAFNPPHCAHIELPRYAAQQIDAQRIVYVPTGQPPHKSDQTLAAAEHRLAMLRLALRDVPEATIDTFELDNDQPSYTVHTLEHLRAKLGDEAEMRLLIGADQARKFEQWYRPRRVEALAEPLVMLRPPDDTETFLAALPADQRDTWRRRIIESPLMDIASTHLRRLLREEPDHPALKDMLTPDVLGYIREHGLYR